MEEQLTTYFATTTRVGPAAHVATEEQYRTMREAGALDDDVVRGAVDAVLFERARILPSRWRDTAVKRSPSMRSRAQAGTSPEKCLHFLSGDEAAAVLRELVAAHPHLVPDAVSAANALLAKGVVQDYRAACI